MDFLLRACYYVGKYLAGIWKRLTFAAEIN